MKSVDISQYPLNRSWDEKVFSMPNIPRGNMGMIAVLKDILTKVKDYCPSNYILTYEGSNSKITLDEACVRLRPMRLVLKNAEGWTLTEESKLWLESGDNLYLAAFLCSNIRFLSEILYYLDIPRKAGELQEIATNEYDLDWKTKSDINSRLVWLRQLGLVDFQEFSLIYSITDEGKAFLKHVKIIDSTKINRQVDITIEEESVPVSEWALLYCEAEKERLVLRKQTIGYIPGNIKDFVDTIAEYLMLINSNSDYAKLHLYASSNYGIAISSFRSFMTMLTNLGFVERKSDTLYVTTEIANTWLEGKGIIEAICCLHSKFLFVFELLHELNGKSLTYRELAAISKVSYGFDKENVDEIRKRISFFKTANLVRNVSIHKFTLTARGKKLLNLAPIQLPKVFSATDTSSIPNTVNNLFDELYTELRVSSKDSMNPNRFEQATKAAFDVLGFNATWFGGSGKTDVLVHAPGAPKYAFTATVDAKSTASGGVTDNLVNFDTLKEHKKKHNADFSVIVGCAFQNERLIKRAIDHKVVLLDVDSLEKLIRQHVEVPIKVASYKKIFEKPGIADISLINSDRRSVMRFGELMHFVMDCLLAESSDEETGGFLMERDIYRSLRDKKVLDELPNIEEITNMLTFLSSPLIGCVERAKEGYYAVGSLSDAARKFSFYSRSCVTDDYYK